MKKIRFAAMMLLVMAMLCSMAMAEVTTTGNVNLRKGPGLGYDLVGDMPEGKTVEYLDETSVDERGVAWYLVDYKGEACWISSKYSQLNNTEPEKTALVFDAANLENYVEVSEVYQMELKAAADELGLENFEVVSSEAPNHYSDEWIIVGGNTNVEFICLTGGEYTIFGAAIGMEIETAAEMMIAAGLNLSSEAEDCWVFEHAANENSYINVDGYDSCINVYVENGFIVEMDWSTYTG